MTRRVLAFAVLFLLSHVGFAATWFVSNSATNGYVVGVDTNAGTTKGTAVLTLTQAHTLAADGDTIQVNCGTYPTGTVPGNPFAISKAITLTPELATAGCFVIQQPNVGSIALDLVHTAGGTINIGSVVIDGAGNGGTGVRVKDGGLANPAYTVVMTGTTVQNFTGQMINATAPTRVNFTFQNGTINQPQNSGVVAVDFHPIVNNAFEAGSINILNTSITALTKTGGTISPVVFAASPGGLVNSTLTVNFTGNTITSNATNAMPSAAYSAVVQVNNVTNAVIKNNTIHVVDAPGFMGTGAIDGIRVFSQPWFGPFTQPANNAAILGNVVIDEATAAGHGILIGEDSSFVASTGHNMANNGEIAGNAVRGLPNSTAIHAVFLGNQTGGVVHDNTALNVLICFIGKGQTGGSFYNNHGFRCSGQGLRSKASSNLNFIANDIHYVPGQAMAGPGSYGMLSDDDTVTGIFSINTLFSGNSIYAAVLPTNFIDAVGVGSTATFDGNNYYLTSGTPLFNFQGTTYNTVPLWSAAHETNLFYQPSGTIGQVF